jgi:hypothetical protein
VDRNGSASSHDVRSCKTRQERKSAEVWFFYIVSLKRGQVVEDGRLADSNLSFLDLSVEIYGILCLWSFVT